jgi:hypothetical protein
MRALRRFSLSLLILAGACQHNATNSPSNPSPSDQTRAKIENRASTDMDISVSRNDGRIAPLGRVAAGETATFGLSPSMTAGAAWVRFQAKPVRGSGETVVSEIFPIHSGDEIDWSVSPQ